MKFCQQYQIHLISDEIYALSIWDNPEYPDAPKFTSVLSIDLTDIIDPKLVHVLWGMSKASHRLKKAEQHCILRRTDEKWNRISERMASGWDV
jgi:uncharacterized tellurite resistance protein B-like protein